MATFTGTAGADIANAMTGVLTGFTGGTVGELQDAIGDSFLGLGGDDMVVAGGGNDTLHGSDGFDTLRGEGGDDVFVYSSNPDIGIDTIDGGASTGADIIQVAFSGGADFRNATIAATGTTSIERLELTGGGDHDVRFLAAQIGATGLAANLVVLGDSGADALIVNNADSLNLAGFQFLGWNAAVDRVFINGTFGDDAITGSSVADIFTTGDGSDVLQGGAGDDFLNGGLGVDTLRGGGDADIFAFYVSNAEIGSDTIDGGAGSDAIEVGFAGLADFTGAAIASTGPTSIERLALFGAGHDVRFNAAQVGATGLASNLTIQGDNAGADLVTFNGATTLNLGLFQFAQWNQAADRVVVNGTGANNAITGTSVADTLNGGGGGDTLNGGAGADTTDGGAGDDFHIVDNAGDQVVEAVGGGSDRVATGVSYQLQAGQEVELMTPLSYTSTTAINLTGNEFNQSIYGNDGVNILDGRGGADAMTGRAGADIYVIDDAGDRVFEAAGGGADRVASGVSYTLRPGQEVELMTPLAYTLTTAINLFGNEFGQAIIGNAGVNIVNGGLGNDSLTGGGGADTFFFNTALNAATNVDAIGDFSVPLDTIRLENAIFTGLATGLLAAGAFNTGAAATQADDRIIYNAANGALIFDADGLGGAAGTRFATLSAGLAMSNADFVVV